MTIEVVGIIAALVALSTGLLRIVESAWNTRQAKKVQSEQDESFCVQPGLTQSEREWLKEIHSVVAKTDDEGTFLVYVPRSLGDVQKEIVTALNSITVHQEKITYILEQLCNKLNK